MPTASLPLLNIERQSLGITHYDVIALLEIRHVQTRGQPHGLRRPTRSFQSDRAVSRIDGLDFGGYLDGIGDEHSWFGAFRCERNDNRIAHVRRNTWLADAYRDRVGQRRPDLISDVNLVEVDHFAANLIGLGPSIGAL